MKLIDLFESDHQLLLELFDKPYPWKVSKYHPNVYFFDAVYTGKNGIPTVNHIGIIFEESVAGMLKLDKPLHEFEYLPSQSIAFGVLTIDPADISASTDIGDYLRFAPMNDSRGNYRVFSTIEKICESHFKAHPTDIIKFSGDGHSRIKLYNKLAKKMAERLNMVAYVEHHTGIESSDYMIINKDLLVNYRPAKIEYVRL